MDQISVGIITKDEERNIEDALKSVAGAGEIIIVDSFSTDKTVEICRNYTDKIYQHDWEGYSRQKQKTVDYSKSHWVLILDADERLTPELRNEIEQTINQTDCNGFYIPRKNYFLGKWIRHSGWWPDHTLRLFRKGKASFEERQVHEKVVLEGKAGYLKNPLEHYTYRSISDFLKKMENYSTLSSVEIRLRSGRAGLYSITVRPFATFMKMFFLRLGFLDGAHGLILATLYSYYTFLKYAKTWEKQD